MKESIVLGLIQNVAILLAFSMLYDYIWIRYEEKRGVYLKVFIGFVIGLIGLVLMLTPWILSPGLVFDTRSILLSVSGLFFGAIPTVIAMIFTGSYRIYLGGDGLFMGITVIITSGTIGIIWGKIKTDFKTKRNIYDLLLMGFIVHLVMLACTLLLPQERILPTIKTIILPLIFIYPFGTMLLGILLLNRDKNWENKKALKESEERFRNIFKSSHAIMFIIDPETGKILDSNNSALSFYGYTHNQFVNDLYVRDLNTLSESEIKVVMNQALVNYKGYFNFKHKLADGSIRDVEVYSGPTIIDNKKVLFSIVHDITDKIKAEAKSDNLNNIIQESLNEIYAFSAENLKFIDANKTAIQNIGYSLNELREMTPLDIKPFLTGLQFSELIDPLIKSEKNKIYFETIHRRKDGTEYPVEVHLQKTNYANSAVFMAIILDITERKNAERNLRESEEKYRILIENQTDLIVKIDTEGKFLYVSNSYCEMFGKTQDELLGNSFMPLVQEDDRESTKKAMESLYSEPYSCYLEQRALTKKGWLWLAWSDKAIVNNDGKIVGIIGVGRDINKQKIAEEKTMLLNEELEQRVKDRTIELNEQSLKLKESQNALLFLLEDINESRDELQMLNLKLEEANKELEAFTYTVSHDLKAPLRAIDGFSNFLLEDYKDKLDEEGLRLINVICENTKKMDQLIIDLLQLSRVNRGEMHITQIDMCEFVKQTYKEIASPEVVKKFKFKVNNIPSAYADQVLLKQVWVNLLGNAIKFTHKQDKCEIEINGEIENEFIVYSIKDSGVGFDTRYESKLFGVFQRLHKTEEFEGTGVGLSIVKRIIDRHGGKVWAESELGVGSTFYFSLPVREEK
ncbi:MAG: PAS domain S-box protein [Bacteroidales bacterium]